MKIIEQGAVKEWSIRVRCTGNGNEQEHRACNSLLEVGYGDLFRTRGGASSEFSYVTIKCISCGVLTNIPDGDVPHEFRAGLPTANHPSTDAVCKRDFRDRDRNLEYDHIRERARIYIRK